MVFPFVILIFYLFMYAQFGSYIYRLNKILIQIEGINEIDSPSHSNQQTPKIISARYMMQQVIVEC